VIAADRSVVRAVRVGADIGRRTEPTAIVVSEERHHAGVDVYVCRRIERLPAGTSYPVVAERIVAISRSLQARSRDTVPIGGGWPVEVWVDATGIGVSVLDLIREREVRAKAVIFSEGDTTTDRDANTVTLGRGYLIGRLQVLLQARRLYLPHTDEATALVAALRDYPLDLRPRAVDHTAPTGADDDLVVALGLSLGPGAKHGRVTVSTWLPHPDEDDWRHPDHVPPWYGGKH
jgi:hypothetical protein